MPYLAITWSKVEDNARRLRHLCGSRGIRLVAVTKGLATHMDLLRALSRAEVNSLAMSRRGELERAFGYRGHSTDLLMMRPVISEAPILTKYAGRFLVSSIEVAAALASAASALERRLDLDFIIEAGDQRDGLDPSEIITALRRASSWPACSSIGVAINIGCTGLHKSPLESLNLLERVFQAFPPGSFARASIGGSAFLPLLENGRLPGFITEIRVGEPILLGTIAPAGAHVPWLHRDAIRLLAEVIQVSSPQKVPQPTHPATTTLALGAIDTDSEALELPRGTEILVTSSDHMVLAGESLGAQVGDYVSFGVRYPALTRSAIAPGVEFREAPDCPMLAAVSSPFGDQTGSLNHECH